MSFLLKYRRMAPPPLNSVLCEAYCETQIAALNFCVVLSNMGGAALELVQMIGGREDAVLDGRDLDVAIDRQRARIEQNGGPDWM